MIENYETIKLFLRSIEPSLRSNSLRIFENFGSSNIMISFLIREA